MLVVAHPLQAYGLADRSREDGRIGAGVFMAVLAVAARSFEVDEPNFVFGQAEGFREDVRNRCVDWEPVQTVRVLSL